MRSWPSAVAAAVALVLCVLAVSWGQSASSQSQAVGNWSMYGETRSFTPGNLWEYIDGAADLFISYGFGGLQAAQYVRDGSVDPGIVVDVYDMGLSLNAFGVFSSERGHGAPALAVGAQGYAADGLMAFWKGRYYVKISILDSSGEAAARALAAQIADHLPGDDQLPSELRRLPPAGRVAGSERYVRKDALGHKALSNVLSADYRVGKSTATLHIADLPGPTQAKQAWDRLRDFERKAGSGLVAVKGAGEAGFAVRDASYGEMMAVRSGRCVVIATSEKATRRDLAGLVQTATAALARAR